MKTQNVRRGSWSVTVSLILSLAVLWALRSPAACAPPAPGGVGPLLGSAASWSDWVQTGTDMYIVHAVSQNLDGRLDIFAIDPLGNVSHACQTAPNSNQYSSGNMGQPSGYSVNSLAVGRNLDGRQEIFAVGTGSAGDRIIWHKWQVAPNGAWSDWQSMGAPANSSALAPAVGRNQDGRMELFFLCGTGEMWHKWQVAPNSGWSDWQSMGQAVSECTYHSRPVVGENKDGRMMVFAIDTSLHEIFFTWQTAVNNGWNGNWVSMGKPPGVDLDDVLDVGRNQDGRAEVFVRGDDGNIWRKWQVAPNSSWSGWGNLGKPSGVILDGTGGVAVGRNQDGRQEVFADGVNSSTRTMWHKWQLTPNGAWSHWEDLGEPHPHDSIGYPKVGRNLDGRLVLFAQDVAIEEVFHKWQTAPPVILTLQQGLNGYTGVVDTWIDADAPDATHSGDAALAVRSDDKMASLLRFNLTGQIPAGSTINSATIMVYVDQAYNESMPATVSLFKMLRWWTSDATWNLARMTVSWGMPGANDAGGDRGYRAVESHTWTSTGWKSFNVTGLVRTWYSNPASNKGVVMKAYGTDGLRFTLSSSQYRNLKLRPKLIINHAPTY